MNDNTQQHQHDENNTDCRRASNGAFDIIADNIGNCGTCKYFEASLCKPTESKNTWEDWFGNEDPADCHRFPPVFVSGSTDELTDNGDFGSLNWQYPKIYACSRICGEYVRAPWLPNQNDSK